jgi:protein SERAC1
LLSKNSAEPHLCEILECTRAIAFLGTPHCGSDMAKWAAIAANFAGLFKQPNKAILRVLEPQSEVLSRIQQEFQSMIRARGRAGKQPIDITCFFEELAVSGVGKLVSVHSKCKVLTLLMDLIQIVPMHSAILPAYPSISIRSNHTDMTKFESAQDPGYVAILDELLRWTSATEVQGSLSRPAMSRNVTSASVHAWL